MRARSVASRGDFDQVAIKRPIISRETAVAAITGLKVFGSAGAIVNWPP